MFLSLDGTFWVQLVNFAIFIAILNVVFLRPVGAAIKKRRAYIDSVRGDLERHEKEALALRAAAEQNAEISKLAAESAARAQAVTDEARRTVAAEFESAKAREGELSAQLATTLLSRATGVRS
jgi:F0F1-type ATP synthase membrane subunit b/b'